MMNIQYMDRNSINYFHLLKDISSRNDRVFGVVNGLGQNDLQTATDGELSHQVVNEVPSTAKPLVTKIKTFLESKSKSIEFNHVVDAKMSINSTGNQERDFQSRAITGSRFNSQSLKDDLKIFIINEGLYQPKSKRLWVEETVERLAKKLTANTDLPTKANHNMTEDKKRESFEPDLESGDRDRIEAALRESETKNRSLLAAIPDLMFRLNQEGVFLDYFPAKDDPNAPDPEDFIGKTVDEVFSADLALWTRCYLEQTLATDSPQVGEYNLRENNTWKHYEARYVPFGTSEILAIVRDITIRKQMEADLRLSQVRERDRAIQVEQTLEQLKHTQTQLIQAEKMSALGGMVAGIAHEINNPIGFIYGNVAPATEYIQDLLDLLSLYQQHCQAEIPAEIEEHIENIDLDFLVTDLPKLLASMKIGAERIQEIVKSLRNFSRLDEGEKKTVDIHEGIENTLLIIQHRLKAKGDRPAIEIEKEYGAIPPVECYAGLMNQVFMNILSNAIDALDSHQLQNCQEDGQNLSQKVIRIRTEVSENKNLVIRISDNGPGIPEDTQKRLFDPFFTTKPVGKGTGLGLSISYSIVEKHRGQLQCISEVGQGSEFQIEIPLRQS